MNDRLEILYKEKQQNKKQVKFLINQKKEINQELQLKQEKINELKTLEKQLLEAPKKLKRTKKEVYMFIVVTFLLSSLAALLLLPEGTLLTAKEICAAIISILSATSIAGILKFSEVRQLNNFIKSNDLKELQIEINTEENLRKLALEKNTEIQQKMDLLSIKQKNISDEINCILNTSIESQLIQVEQNINTKKSQKLKKIGTKNSNK